VQDNAPREAPHGKLSNPPVPVADDLPSIVRALGGDPALLSKMKSPAASRTGLPTTEY
jgi:hypothetical protein